MNKPKTHQIYGLFWYGDSRRNHPILMGAYTVFPGMETLRNNKDLKALTEKQFHNLLLNNEIKHPAGLVKIEAIKVINNDKDNQ